MVRHYRSIVVTMSLAVSVALMISDLAYAQNPASNLLYPKSKVVDQIDDYHGTKINDPFRWLEDVDSEETKNWVVEQNKLTFDYLESIPARARFKQRLTELWNFERYGLPRQ